MSQFIVSELSQQHEGLSVALAIYIDDAFDYQTAKAAAQAAESDFRNTEMSLLAATEQLQTLQKQIGDLQAQMRTKSEALQAAQRALYPDAAIRIEIPASDFQPILDDPKLPTAAEKIQAAINLKRAEIEAQVKAQSERLKLIKEAQGTVVGVPVSVTAQALTLDMRAATRRTGKGKRGQK